MPTYEYECQDCGNRFEKFQRMSDKPVRKCPQCGGKAKKLISVGGGIIVKGGSSGTQVTACGGAIPCCGRDTPCDRRPCEV